MIILDTTVISELMRGTAVDGRVLKWLRSLGSQPVTTVVNRAEIIAGIALLPRGQRRDRLAAGAQRALSHLGVCLPLTEESADRYGAIVATRRASGQPIGGMDALIAAIALETGASIATRDVSGFAGLGLTVIDPWSGATSV